MKKGFIYKFAVIIFMLIISLNLMSYDTSKDFETAKNLDIFYSLFTEISNSYVDELAPGDLMERTLTEMLKTLDPYTNFIPESDVERYTILTKGEYGGIGATVTDRDNSLMIIDIRENSPAQKSGLLVGDFITSVDGHSILNEPAKESRELLQGEAGTTLHLGILRNNENLNISVVREKIKIGSVPYYGIIDQQYGYIKLNEFSQECANDVYKACTELKKKQAKAFILDLRDNPGGLLIEAIKIVNMFVPKGERIVFTKGQKTTENSKFSTISDPFDTEIPLVVLVNEHSASAAEIVSGSLQDLDRAVVIGLQTFGKGLVQTRKELPHNCLLKITTSKYYIPSGRCIQKLDYSHRDSDGNPTSVPDSLQKTFYTRNHRPVKDGGGIIPDIIVTKDSSSSLLADLRNRFVLFDFINKNYSHKDTINIKPETYIFSESDYSKFLSFCKESNYSFISPSEKLLLQFAEATNNEQINVDNEVQHIQEKINLQQEKLFELDKTAIMQELGLFIIRHLYFEKGQIEYSIRDDEYITKAKEVLNNKDLYDNILQKK
ncbi:MAG: S41 family peptidase [Bacteroidales bacterium]|nr:S41 family peptidase [Bacteroidales bacterium]